LEPVIAEASAGPAAADRLVLGLLAAGHLSVDLCQAAVPAMLPFFILERGLSYSAAAGLVLAQTLSSSVIQPLFGHLTDRRPAPWVMPLGIVVAAAGIAAATLLPTYTMIWLAIAVSGVGVAAYHPEGARYARYSSGSRQAQGMSVFSVGGNIGFAAGPIVMTPVLLLFGLSGGWLGMLVPLSVAVAIIVGLQRIDKHRITHVAARIAAGVGRDDWSAFARLTAALVCRSALFYGLNTFLPLYWIFTLHQSKAAGGAALAILLVAGGFGTLLGGRLGDRFSKRLVVIAASAASALLLLITLGLGDPVLAAASLVPLALAVYIPSSIMTVLGQDYLPNRIGTAAGVTTGLSFSVGGLLVPVLGQIGDHAGLHAALMALVAAPVAAALLGLTLPEPARKMIKESG
jgi:MFS transporter, FSR family, fosmidomycin resistance protein